MVKVEIQYFKYPKIDHSLFTIKYYLHFMIIKAGLPIPGTIL